MLPPYIQKLLKLWVKLGSNVRMRDRIVKVIQYGCQMILGFYTVQLSEQLKSGLAETRRFASNARKAFWLLKSFNHISTCINMYENGVLQTEYIADKIDYLEQIFLAIYFATENFVFFIRSKVLSMKEESIDIYLNCSWFGADVSALCSSILRLYDNNYKLNQVKSYINYTKTTHTTHTTSHNSDLLTPEVTSQNPISLLQHCPDLKNIINQYDNIDKLILNLTKKQYALYLTNAINVFEVGVSFYYMGLYKRIFGVELSEGYVGAMGVISSTLILYEGGLGYLEEVREEEEAAAVRAALRQQTSLSPTISTIKHPILQEIDNNKANKPIQAVVNLPASLTMSITSREHTTDTNVPSLIDTKSARSSLDPATSPSHSIHSADTELWVRQHSLTPNQLTETTSEDQDDR